jgi:hypothetical protein
MDNILRELLESAREERGDDADVRELAHALLNAVLTLEPEQASELLFPVVLPWVKQREHERARVRDFEQRAFSPLASKAHGNPAQEAMRRLLAQRCYVPGNGMVPWGMMTRDLHELRISYLEKKLEVFTAGTRATIARHAAAVALLADSGLGDLNAYAEQYGELPPDLAREQEGAVTA